MLQSCRCFNCKTPGLFTIKTIKPKNPWGKNYQLWYTYVGHQVTLSLFGIRIQAKREDERLRDWLQQRDDLDKGKNN